MHPSAARDDVVARRHILAHRWAPADPSADQLRRLAKLRAPGPCAYNWRGGYMQEPLPNGQWRSVLRPLPPLPGAASIEDDAKWRGESLDMIAEPLMTSLEFERARAREEFH